jgi:hypothetical protein
MVCGAEQRGGVGMIMGRRIIHRKNFRALGAAIAFLVALPYTANCFEATRGSGAAELPADRPAPVVAVEDNTKRISADVCFHRIGPNLEKQLERFMVRLSEPYQKSGETFEWRIGNESGATYWSWAALDGFRHQMTLYFPALDLMIKTTVSSTIYAWSDGPAFEQGDHWVGDLLLTFVDETTNEGLRVAYWSRADGNKDEMGRTLPKFENRNVGLKMIERGTSDCRMGG